MKNSLLKKVGLFVILGALLSACEPRDIKYLPDSAIRGRGGATGSGNRGGSSFTLSDYATLVHVVERQVEALSVLEMVLNPDFANDLGYETLRSDRGTSNMGFVRFDIKDEGAEYRMTSDDSWSYKSARNIVEGQGVHFVSETKSEKEKSGLRLGENTKFLKIEKTETGSFKLRYIVKGEMVRMVGKKNDQHALNLAGDLEVERTYPGNFKILKSEFEVSNNRMSDRNPFRIMKVKPSNDQNVEIKVSSCPQIKGLFLADYTGRYRGHLSVEYTENLIRQISGRGAPQEEVQGVCENSLHRSLIDISRFLRK